MSNNDQMAIMNRVLYKRINDIFNKVHNQYKNNNNTHILALEIKKFIKFAYHHTLEKQTRNIIRPFNWRPTWCATNCFLSNVKDSTEKLCLVVSIK